MSETHNREALLERLMVNVPYLTFMGFEFEAEGDTLNAKMPYRSELIGNPSVPALHGGTIAAFLEVTAFMTLGWSRIWLGDGGRSAEGEVWPSIPKTIDLTIDYMRSGKPQDTFAKARITRAGRRFATVHATAWQGEPDRPIADAMCHFLMPRRDA
ncbi:PaaI family thioesterase [Celeribacter sp.]|uniref:PaaI family thioesterase n=1 Tax=Celeribacter sp. TaxID=1890673 RepID=UPI003A90B1CA